MIRIKNTIEFNNIGSFSLKNTLDCGQCFRWEEQVDGSYLGIVRNNVVKEKEQVINYMFFVLCRSLGFKHFLCL